MAYLLICCCVDAASMVVRFEHGLYGTLFLDLPFCIAATLSVCFFYIATQRELGLGWWGRLKYLPFLMSLGIGLAINNARAVVEAIFRQESGFTRTPKTGSEGKSVQKVQKAYRGKASWMPYVELAFGAYFSWAVWFAWDNDVFTSLPFLVLFARLPLRRRLQPAQAWGIGRASRRDSLDVGAGLTAGLQSAPRPGYFFARSSDRLRRASSADASNAATSASATVTEAAEHVGPLGLPAEPRGPSPPPSWWSRRRRPSRVEPQPHLARGGGHLGLLAPGARSRSPSPRSPRSPGTPIFRVPETSLIRGLEALGRRGGGALKISGVPPCRGACRGRHTGVDWGRSSGRV